MYTKSAKQCPLLMKQDKMWNITGVSSFHRMLWQTGFCHEVAHLQYWVKANNPKCTAALLEIVKSLMIRYLFVHTNCTVTKLVYVIYFVSSVHQWLKLENIDKLMEWLLFVFENVLLITCLCVFLATTEF